MHRSGSTLVWQIARHLMDGHPRLRNPRGLSTDTFPEAAADPEDLLMAKVHFRTAMARDDFPDEGAKYLYTYRDPRDVVASLYRKGRLKQGDAQRGARNSRLITRRELRGDAFWRGRADVWVRRYEDFKDDVPALVGDLARYLDVEVTGARVEEIVALVDIAAQEERAEQARRHGVDEDLRVTSHHITDGRAGAWRDTLTTEETEAIEAESAAWLVAHGYPVETEAGRRALAPAAPTPAKVRIEPRAVRMRRERSEDRAALKGAAPALLIAGVCGAGAWASAGRHPAVAVLAGIGTVTAAAAGAYRLGQRRVPLRRVARTLAGDVRRLLPGGPRFEE